MRWTWLAFAAVLSVVIAGCGIFPVPSAPPPVDPAMLTLHVANGTTLPVSIAVNGEDIGVVRPGDELDVPSGILSAMPWSVEARSPTGRLLTSMVARREDIRVEDVGNGATQVSGTGVRADLSCGRLDVWVGLRPLGPVPGPGTPGDCVP